MSKPNFAKILKYRYFNLCGLLLTFVYNVIKGKNWAEILYTEAIVLLIACDTLKITKFWNDEEKDLIPGEEGAKLREDNYISKMDAGAFYRKLRASRIDRDNKPNLMLIQDELNKKIEK